MTKQPFFSRFRFRLKPPQVVMLSFALTILVGALLLNLPAASQSGVRVGFLDALFTATSANCVTGLVVVNTLHHWTIFGQIVILVLIQLGALGFITVMTLFMVFVKRQISLKDRMVIQASFNQNRISGMVRLVKKIVGITFVIEAIGTVLLATAFWLTGIPLGRALYMGLFHAVSAFCNAGFDIVGTTSLMPYSANVFINLVIMLLIIAGGIGFTVWADLFTTVRCNRRRSLRTVLGRLSLHSKIALSMTLALILSGTVLFLCLEWHNPATLGAMPAGQKVLAACFQSVTLRTAGFNTIDQAGLTEASQFVSCIYMLIGGSPASAAGGIKTVTLGVIIASMLSVLKGRRNIEAFGRTIPLDILQKALSVFTTMMIVLITSSILLYFTERGTDFAHTFLDLLFETASAAGTVGVTTGITPHLSALGRIVLVFCMYLGRLSPVTVVVALNMRLHAGADGLSFPDERVIIG